MLKKLKDECYIVMGQSPSSTNYNQDKNGIPFMQGRKTFGDKYPTIDTWTTKLTKIAPKGSVLMSVRAPVGDVNIAPCDLCIGRGLASIKMKNGNNQYLYYLLKNNSNLLKNKSTGTIFESINKDDLENLVLNFSDENNQIKISKILSDIDKKIELNNEINNNLYEISKQLLLKYLNENSSFKEISISQLLNVFTGKKNANETTLNGKYKFFSCSPESLLSDTYLYDGPAIIVAGNGAYTGRTRFYDGKFELYQRTYGLTLKDGINKNNVYGLYVFMKTFFEPDKMGGTHGSAIPYIVLSDLTDYKLKYNKSEFDKFSDLVSSNIKMIQENEKLNEELFQLRDTLLPKLMNGEIDLDNVGI